MPCAGLSSSNRRRRLQSTTSPNDARASAPILRGSAVPTNQMLHTWRIMKVQTWLKRLCRTLTEKRRKKTVTLSKGRDAATQAGFCLLSPPCPLERQREVRKEGRRGWREERLQGKKIGGRNMRKNERKNGRRKERKKERMNQIILSSVRQAGKNISAWNPGNLSLWLQT